MINRSLVFEVVTTNYEDDKEKVSSVMTELQKACGVNEGFLLSNPVAKFGWTFFKILFKSELISGIQEKFGSLIMESKSKAMEEKFVNFITKFFESRNCKVRMKLVED